MKFHLELKNVYATDAELLNDMIRVAKSLEKSSLSQNEYKQHGKYASSTVCRRFGSWNKALEKANLAIVKIHGISDEELFKNIEDIWIKLGRQPRRREIIKPFSKYSAATYRYRFETWNDALKQFMNYIDQGENDINVWQSVQQKSGSKIHKTKRAISDRLRFLIMKRDDFKCRKCGRSPANEAGVILHIDHNTAWTKGGESTFDNLQTLCSNCNLGKGNLE